MRARAPADAHDLGDREFVERSAPVPEPQFAPRLDRPDDRAPLAPLPHPDQPSLFTRVTRAVAAVFSVAALVGVSSLTLVLVASGEPPATVTAKDAALATVTAWSASTPLVSSKRVDAPTEISAIVGKQNMSGVPSATAPARGGGTTRPIDTQTAGRFADRAQPAESWGAREGARSTRSVAIAMHFSLRFGPNNDAAVVAVGPAGLEVVDCTQWCEVVYNGWRGFIYRKFASGAEQ
jgi:hypothetical protein